MSDRIKVGVKVRPLIHREKAEDAKILWRAASDDTITQVDPVTGVPKGEPFLYDHVFSPASSNQEVFEALVRPIVEAAVRGFNGTIFAYGQTASGKTYTMMGDQYEPGVIPQAVNLIFNTIENTHGREFLLRVCYMEIYNEKVNDLLAKSNRNLKVSEDSTGNVFVKDLQETITSSSQMVMDLMKKGETIRKIGVTNMNERSSRSHSIFRVIIESRIAGSDANEAIQVSHLNLVDLAGSERSGATGCVGEQLKEGCAINKSLFSLGKVIAQLSEGGAQYVNFRDSKLTRILQSSLGGNALTAIICAVTPAALEETSSTLGFASRARNIKNTATVNEVLSDGALLKRYVKQIARLTSKISTLEEEKVAENQHLLKENDLLQERISRLKAALLTSDFSEPSVKSEKLKKLRRRTWSAPNRTISRMSLAPVSGRFASASGLDDIQEEDRSGALLSNADLDTSVFSTPLEEFEKALIKAERDKSMDGSDWFPPADVFSEDIVNKASDEDIEHHPPISYVQTRRQKKNPKFPEIESAPETPPSKLRAKISVVEKELDEMNEFTRLEKQIYDEELAAARADLSHAKNQLSEVMKDNKELKKLMKSKDECIQSLQNERTDFDIQLDMRIAKYESRIKDLTGALEDARYELSLVPHTPRQRKCIGKLYAVEEEPSIDELLSDVKCLKDENKELHKFQTLHEDLCKELQLKEGMLSELSSKITNLEETILELSSRPAASNSALTQSSIESDNLMDLQTKVNALEEDLEAATNILRKALGPERCKNDCLPNIASDVALNLTHANERVLELESLCSSVHATLLKDNLSVNRTEPEMETLMKVNDDLTKEINTRDQLLAEATMEVQHLKELLDQKVCNTQAKFHTKDIQYKDDLICESAIEIENPKEIVETLPSKLTVASESEVTPNLCDAAQRSALENRVKELDEDLSSAKNLLCSSLEDPGQFGSCSLTSMLSAVLSQAADAKEIKADLQSSKSSILELRETNHRLMEEVSRAEHVVTTLREESNNLAKEIDCKDKLLAESAKELQHLKEVSDQQIKVELARLEDVSRKLGKDVQAKDDLICQSAIEMENLRETVETLKSKFTAASESEVTPNLCDAEKLSALENRVKELDEDLSSAKNLLCSSLEDPDQFGSCSLTSMLSAVLSQAADAKEVKADLQSSKSSILELREANHRLMEEVSRAEHVVTTLKEETNYLAKEIDCKDKLLAESAEELQHLKEVSDQQIKKSLLRPHTEQIIVSDSSSEELLQIKEELTRLENINSKLVQDIQAKEDIICKSAIEMEKLRETNQTLSSKLKAASESEFMPNLCDAEKLSALESELKERDEDVNAAKSLLCSSMEDLNRFGHSTVTSMLSDFLSHISDTREMCSGLADQQIVSNSTDEGVNELRLGKCGYLEPTVVQNQSEGKSSDSEVVPFNEESSIMRMEIHSQSERYLEFEKQLIEIQTILKDAVGGFGSINAPVPTIVSELLLTLNSLKCKCAELEKNNQEYILQLEVLKKTHSESLSLAKSEIEALETSKGILMEELENKKILLKETERETRLLREKVRASSNKPFSLSTDSEGFAEEMASCKSEVEFLLAEKEALQAELESKNSLLLETEGELQHLKGVGHELWRTLQEEEEVCKSCSVLKENLRKEENSKLLLEDKLADLQKLCEDWEIQIKCTRKSLIAEVSAISERTDLEDLPLPELIAELMNSIMKAQKHVASVLQSKIDFYHNSLEVCEEREVAHAGSILKLEQDVKELNDKNAQLIISLQNSQVDLQESESRAKHFHTTCKKLASFLDVTDENPSLETIMSAIESKFVECQLNGNHDSSIALLAEDNQNLKSKLAQVEEQVLDLRKSLKVSKENASKLEQTLNLQLEKSKKLQDNELRAKESLRDLSDELECKVEQMSTLEVKFRQLEEDLQAQASKMEEEFLVKLNDEISKREADIEALKKEVKQKVDLIDSLRANVKALETNLETHTCKLEEHKKKLEKEITQRDEKISHVSEELDQKTKTIKSLTSRLEELELTLEAKRMKLEEEFKIKWDNEISKENALRDSLISKLRSKSETVQKLEEMIADLKETVTTQSKQISGKESLQNRAASLYNDLSEMKELVKELEKEKDQYKAHVEDKEKNIQSMLKSIEVLKGEKSDLEADLFRANANKDQAIKALALKMKEGPQDEIQELKADLEFQKTQLEEAMKASRDLRIKNRRLQADLAKSKTLNEENEKSVNDLTEQVYQLSRTTGRSSRVSDLKMKNEARDARQTKAELEVLKEAMSEKERELNTRTKEATNLAKVVQDKEQIINDLKIQLELCRKSCGEKSDKIVELDKECEDMLSWGKSVEQNHGDLANRLEVLLKDLAESKLKLFSAGEEKIRLLKTLIEEVIGSVSKLSSDQIEMQLSSKEKAVNNAKARVEKLALKVKSICGNLVDFDILQAVCADLHSENEQIHSLGEEVLNMFNKVVEKKKLSDCAGCEEMKKWGIEQEKLANENIDRVDQLRGLLQNCNCMEVTLQKKTKSDEFCDCQDLRSKVRAELADRKAEIVKLKMLQEVKNKPLEDSIRQLREKLKLYEQKIANLKAENRRMFDTLQEPTVCSASGRKDADTQTYESSNQIYQSQYWSSGSSGIIDESNRAVLEAKCRQLEKEKDAYKKLCISRKERNDALERELRQYVKDKENQENQHHGYLTRSRKNN